MVKKFTNNALFILFICLSCQGRAQTISTYVSDGLFEYIWDAAKDTLGNIYFTDNTYSRIRKMNAVGTITTVLGAGTGSFGINGPTGITIDHAGNIYFCNAHNYVVCKMSYSGVITVIAGTGIAGFSGDGGPAVDAEINKPYGIAVDAVGRVYFADAVNNRVRKIDTSGIISTVAGTVTAGFSGDGGPATLAQLSTPYGVTVDTAGNIYITDQGNQRVRKVNPLGIITTIAGTGTAGFSGDGGPATAANLYTPWGIAIDPYGALFVSDHFNSRIRKISGGVITTVAGIDTAGYSGDGGPATNAKLNQPSGITFDRQGNMYICDWQNSLIRKVTSSNYPPHFIDTTTQYFTLCSGTAVLDSFLSILDTNAGQTISWNILLAPTHGTASIAYSTVATGGIVTPSGTTYTPATGYSGKDTIRIRGTDGMSDDTITMVVQVGLLNPTIHSDGWYCLGFSQTLTSPDTGGIWTSDSLLAPITPGGHITYLHSGRDTVIHTITNMCGAATDTLTFQIWRCEYVAPVSDNDNAVAIFPNPNNGTFDLSISYSNTEEVDIAISDITGRRIKELTTVTNKTNEIKLDATAGVYFVQATTKNGMWCSKIFIDNVR